MEGGLSETLTTIFTGLKGQLQAMNIESLLHNPYFLAASAVFAVIAVAKRMVSLLVLYLAGIALAALFHYTVPGGDVSQLDAQQLLTFAGGALAVCGVLIYFLFIRAD